VTTTGPAEAFAREWLEAWNSHDLERILAHYAEDVEFLSPFARQRVGSGRIRGKAALRAYWAAALASQPNLAFELLCVYAGHDALAIRYRNHRGQEATEAFEFGGDGLVIRSSACYAPA